MARYVVPAYKYADELKATAAALSVRGKGFLAADESTATIGKRFSSISVENNETNRRDYRELLFRTKGWSQYISGVILYEETLNQKAEDGTPLVDIIKAEGVIVGIKVDKGLAPILGTNGETAAQGHDGLAARAAEYYKKGARFAKWRAVIQIGENIPSELSINENTRGLARYASICQENGLVPIVEPEVLMDGDHSIEVCAAVTERVWAVQIAALHEHKLLFEGLLLKPSMVLSGSTNKPSTPVTPEVVAHYTYQVLSRTIPPAIPGIFFLSGGLSEEEATLNLNALNQRNNPWSLSFSYGRALQASTLKAWAGKKENVAQAQKVFLERCKANSEAQLGKYAGGGGVSSKESLFVADYKY